jgi:hypothetical protein
MYVTLFTACALFAQSPAATPAVMTDYRQAREIAAREQKPLAVVIGRGVRDAEDLIDDESDVRRVSLRTSHVWVVVDTKTDAGRKLADEFNVTRGPALVLSDRTGDLQAYRHEGRMAAETLKTVLHRYSDPDMVVRTTESNVQPRASMSNYQPATSYYPPAPVYAPFMGGGCAGGMCGGGGCAGGRCR